MSNSDAVLDMEHDELGSVIAWVDGVCVVFAGEIERGIGRRAFREEEGWFVVIRAVGDTVHGPEPMARGILNEINGDIDLLRGRLRSGRIVRDKGRRIHIEAWREGIGPRGASRGQRLVRTGVIDGCEGKRIECPAARLNLRSQPITLTRFPDSRYKDIHSLRNSKGDKFNFLPDDGNKIRRNDDHLVVVNADMQRSLGTRIDKPKTVYFTRFKEEFRESGVADTAVYGILRGTIEIILAVDEIVVGCAGPDRLCFIRAHQFLDEVCVVGMVVIVDKYGTQINVVVVGRWTVDNHGTKETGGVLRTEVRMVPGCPIEVCTEAVGVSVAGGNGTLMNSRDAVHVGLTDEFVNIGEDYTIYLEKTVPVNRSSFIEIVLNRDFPPIAPIGLHRRTRVLLIDNNHLPC